MVQDAEARQRLAPALFRDPAKVGEQVGDGRLMALALRSHQHRLTVEQFPAFLVRQWAYQFGEFGHIEPGLPAKGDCHAHLLARS